MASRNSLTPFSLLIILAFMLVLPLIQIAEAQTDGRGQKAQQKESRTALIIGNSAYTDAPLRNPVNDARDMAQVLRELDFDVTYGENLSQNEMKRSIRSFGDKIRNGGVGLFYYAGHGIQVDGVNYLIPIGATITKEEEVEYESVDVGFVLAQMKNARNRLNIVILDACRNNPFARSFRSTQSGLASIDAPSGTLIAYATAPGSVASDGQRRNGLYTEELLKQIRVPSLNIEQVFKQVRLAVRDQTQSKQIPWESSSLIGDFYFATTPIGATKIGGNPPLNNKPEIFDPQQYYTSSLDNFNRGAYDRALSEINRAIELSPAFAQAYVVRAGIYHLRNSHDNAIADSNKAIELNINHESPYLIRGASYNLKGDFDLAIADFNKALQYNAQSGAAYYGLGTSYVGKRDYDRAIVEYTKAIKFSPKDAQSHYNRGTAYYRKNDFDRALADFNKAIENDSKLAVAYNNRALVYEKKGDRKRAEADRKKYRELTGNK